jgi:hypothetical protein
MKTKLLKWLTFLLAILAVGSLSFAEQKAHSSLETELTAIEKHSWEAWQKRDGKFYENFLSDDHVEVGGGGLSTKKEVAQFVGSPVCVVKSYALRDFTLTRFNAETALLTYHAEQDTTCHGKLVTSPVWVSSLYVKRKGKWQNALYQQTNKP